MDYAITDISLEVGFKPAPAPTLALDGCNARLGAVI
jgi:hypothetical protein